MIAERRARAAEQTLAAAQARLAAAGIASPRLDARVLLGHAAGCDAGAVAALPDRCLTVEVLTSFDAMLARRIAREPVSRIRGRREFWSLDILIGRDTLDPRPDSETVVETALSLVSERHAPLALLDLGTGSGCLLLALLNELPQAWGLGIDIAPGALGVAAANAARLGQAARARFACTDWTRGIAGRFDLVVANPPYVAEPDFAALEPEVSRHEPRRALAAGADGLDAYRAIGPELASILAPDGHAVLEFGDGQAEVVGRLMAAAGLQVVGVRDDLGGRRRCIILRR
ncbi:MAG: peptide chain release factor N(5)-glutamine methyltransferase [Alphaproteobacteria bacterium]|nr:peptide chain release factor N(5)-glutamine methyltransferase [Alphaproteobacteria bacterium]